MPPRRCVVVGERDGHIEVIASAIGVRDWPTPTATADRSDAEGV